MVYEFADKVTQLQLHEPVMYDVITLPANVAILKLQHGIALARPSFETGFDDTSASNLQKCASMGAVSCTL